MNLKWMKLKKYASQGMGCPYFGSLCRSDHCPALFLEPLKRSRLYNAHCLAPYYGTGRMTATRRKDLRRLSAASYSVVGVQRCLFEGSDIHLPLNEDPQ